MADRAWKVSDERIVEILSLSGWGTEETERERNDLIDALVERTSALAELKLAACEVCPECSTPTVASRHDETFDYGAGDGAVVLVAEGAVTRTCPECGFSSSGAETEAARSDAVCRHLGERLRASEAALAIVVKAARGVVDCCGGACPGAAGCQGDDVDGHHKLCVALSAIDAVQEARRRFQGPR